MSTAFDFPLEFVAGLSKAIEAIPRNWPLGSKKKMSFPCLEVTCPRFLSPNDLTRVSWPGSRQNEIITSGVAAIVLS